MAKKKAKKATPPPAQNQAHTRAREAKYIPPAIGELATAEKKLLAVLIDPRNIGKTALELSDLAGVSRHTYYRLSKNPEFHRKKNEVILAALRDISPTLKACIETSKMVGREGAADRKLLLEIAGIYRPRLAVEQASARNVEGDMPDEEALWWYQYLKYPPDRWLPSIRLRWENKQIKPKKPVHLDAEQSDAL